MSKLKPYMGYSREFGSCEGAILIFAHDLKEAKRLAYPPLTCMGIVEEYIDMAVDWLKDHSFLFNDVPQWSKDNLSKDIPHVVESPPSCKSCLLWGYELENGLCESCRDEEEFVECEQ